MKIDQYCQRQRCKHVELEQFLACFRIAAGLSATAGLSCYIPDSFTSSVLLDIYVQFRDKVTCGIGSVVDKSTSFPGRVLYEATEPG